MDDRFICLEYCSDEERNKKLKKHMIFFNIVDNLINLNKMNRNVNFSNIMGRINFLKEFCTIKIDIGRQIGKTEYIFKNAKENDLVILYNSFFKRNCLKRYNDIIKFDILTIDKLCNKNEELKIYNTIWVDECSFIKKEKIDRIYDLLGNGKVEQTFILFG